MRKLLLLLLILWFAIPPCLIAGSVNHENKTWTKLGYHSYFNPRVKYYLQLQNRFGNNDEFYDRSIISAASGYVVNKRLSLWLGYDFLTILNSSSNSMNYQNRLWQQISWKALSAKSFPLHLRTRLEQRVITNGSGLSLRLRERFRLAYIDLINDEVTPIISDEVFLYVNHPEWVTSNTVDQNRAFVGFRFPSSKHTTFEIGYLNQYKIRDPDNQMNHILYLSFVFWK